MSENLTTTNEDVFKDIKIHRRDPSEISQYRNLENRVSAIEKQFQLKNLDSLDSKVRMDFENGTITISDGTNDRIIIGKLS